MIKAPSFLPYITGFVLLSFLNFQERSTKRGLSLSSKIMIHNCYYWGKKEQYTATTNYYSAKTNTPKNNSAPEKFYQDLIASPQDSNYSHYATLILNNSIFKYFEYN